ncbi:MAG: hypothetical protein ACSHW7_13435 [Patiriisocius sp.]|uniref:hypothetical protein n=1 Tax=Patiriisocius sp. TaxID=2822396 RepID=UPI003EF5B390
MKLRFLTFAIFLVTLSSATSCREKTTETKTVIREVEVEKVEKNDEGILERAAKKVDNEVNEEIDKKIDKIGNDD